MNANTEFSGRVIEVDYERSLLLVRYEGLPPEVGTNVTLAAAASAGVIGWMWAGCFVPAAEAGPIHRAEGRAACYAASSSVLRLSQSDGLSYCHPSEDWVNHPSGRAEPWCSKCEASPRRDVRGRYEPDKSHPLPCAHGYEHHDWREENGRLVCKRCSAYGAAALKSNPANLPQNPTTTEGG